MKKILLIGLLTLLAVPRSYACAGDYGYYNPYYSAILSQELINDSRYYPFLLSPYLDYYQADSARVKNANIEEWQQYLHIPYAQAHYLVFNSSKADIDKIINRKSVSDKQLQFANAAFATKYKDALAYLYTAKELEPYMVISGHNNGWGYYEKDEYDIDNLPYDRVSLQLQKGWKQAKDNEIKLRYGYQLVRFAHYNRRYDEAIQLFDIYVEPLNHKSEMYYYALSQKAGAMRGKEDYFWANRVFFEVFMHSADLKASALSSLRLNDGIDYSNIWSFANTIEEKNDADLLLGYMSFSNPLASARHIIQRTPDAVQAKVLAARAIATIESDIEYGGDVTEYNDRRFPILEKGARGYFEETLRFVTRQADSDAVKQKNYWNITSAYMLYLDRQYPAAQSYLDKVDVSEEGYKLQRDVIAMLIDIGREEYIDSEVEERLFAQYNDIFTKEGTPGNRTQAKQFVLDLLSNRYYLQEDFAKSFMLLNVLRNLEDNPNTDLLYAIRDLYNKPDKNSFEQDLVKSFRIGLYNEEEEARVTVPQYIDYMLGFIYISSAKPEEAERCFSNSGYSKEEISSDIFGYNEIECFSCDDVMRTDYLSDFPDIKDAMTERELATALTRLRDATYNDDQRGAKASYLLGNFYYNVSATGYYRDYLRFGYSSNYHHGFFPEEKKEDIFTNQMNLKDIPVYYSNTVATADRYLTNAYRLATGDEFKARVAFALSKCEQEEHYEKLDRESRQKSWKYVYSEDWVMITNRKYFRELNKYKNTRFHKEVVSNCKYFEYYVNHYQR